MTRTIKGEPNLSDIRVILHPSEAWEGSEDIEIDIRRDTLRETRFSRREVSEVIQALSKMLKDL